MTEAEVAWAAGFFDGEGCTYFSVRAKQKGRQRRYGYIGIGIAQTHPEVLERFQKITQAGKVYGPYPGRSKNENEYWRFTAHHNDALKIIELIQPYLGSVKLAQAEAALEKYRPFAEREPLKTGPKAKEVVAA